VDVADLVRAGAALSRRPAAGRVASCRIGEAVAAPWAGGSESHPVLAPPVPRHDDRVLA